MSVETVSPIRNTSLDTTFLVDEQTLQTMRRAPLGHIHNLLRTSSLGERGKKRDDLAFYVKLLSPVQSRTQGLIDEERII